jgi:hypothetical protein
MSRRLGDRLPSGRTGRQGGWLERSTLAVAHLRLAPTSSASSSVTERFSPSGVSQLRWRSRPVTITRSPLPRDSARFSAWPRQTFTLKKLVSPSRYWPSCWMRWVTATRRLVTGDAVLGEADLGVLDQVRRPAAGPAGLDGRQAVSLALVIPRGRGGGGSWGG